MSDRDGRLWDFPGLLMMANQSSRKMDFLEECRRFVEKMKIERKKIELLDSEKALWYPVRTLPRHEAKLYGFLADRGISVYLPVVPDVSVHNLHHKDKSYQYEDQVLRPMLSSYLFAQLDETQKRAIWISHSVRVILDVPRIQQKSFLEELRGLQVMEELAFTTKVEYKREIAVNDRFMIEYPRQFEGTYGYLVERRKRFLWVIRMEMLGAFVSAEIDPREFKFSKI